MSASLKEVTAKEVAENQRKLQASVSQLDAQINTINNKWDILEAFIKKWWSVAVAIFGIIVALISGTLWWVNNIVTKDNVNRVERRLNLRIDSLIKNK